MKLFFVLLMCLCAVGAAAAEKAPAKKKAMPKITVVCTPGSHIAGIGEEVKFAVASDSGEPVQVTVSLDGGPQVFKKVTVKPPAEVTASLDRPGFLHCLAVSGGATVRQGVAVAPEKIRYARNAPADFKQFWASALEESAKLPLDLKLEPVSPHKEYDSFLMSCANVNGKRAYALFSRPKVFKGKLPLLVLFGGGEAATNLAAVPGAAMSAKKRLGQDAAVLYLHLPPYPPAPDRKTARTVHKEFLKKLGLRRYILVGLEDPRKFYAYSAILGGLRLVNAAAALPGIDREKCVFHGASHGGMIGAYLAYFFPFRAVFLGVPSSCEINAFLENRLGSAAREWKDHWKTTEYFDLVYFADGIRCPVLVGVGFWDRSCPPTGVYSFYNRIPPGRKQIFNKIHYGHGGGPAGYQELAWEFLARHLAAPAPATP